MGINLNFSGVESGFKPIPEGDYTLVITSAELKDSKDGESTNLILKLAVSGGEYDGKSILQYLNIQESTMWRVKEFFVALTGDEELQEFDLDDPSELVGHTIGATVTINGKYNSVDAWYSA